jgi:hypothetical protein
MGWATLADLVLKTTISTFKTAGVWTSSVNPGAPVSIYGVFNAPNMDINLQAGAVVQSVEPSFGVRLADLPAAPDSGDTLVINGVTYRINNVDEDGQGGAKLILGKIS